MARVRKSAVSVVIARLVQEHPDEYATAHDADCGDPLNWDQHDLLDLAERYYPAEMDKAFATDSDYAAAEDTGTLGRLENED